MKIDLLADRFSNFQMMSRPFAVGYTTLYSVLWIEENTSFVGHGVRQIIIFNELPNGVSGA